MDSVGGVQGKLTQAAVRWNTDAIKEPRGFIKFIEFVIAIFAFATTTSSSSKSSFYFKCSDNSETDASSLSWSYPFKIDQSTIMVQFCNKSDATYHNYKPYGDFSAPSQFYVFVGVMAFLYCIGAVILYVCFDDKYRKFDKIPIIDFIVSCVFVLLWLISSSAWATGVSQLKEYTNPDEWLETFIEDDLQVYPGDPVIKSAGNFATLNVSLIFGFLNMCVWAGNLWFLYKETKWFKVETEHPQTSPSETPQQI